MLFLLIYYQIVSGVLISYHYTIEVSISYHSIQYLLKEVYYGWCLQLIHSSGVSLVFNLLFIHIIRGLYISSYLLSTTIWL